MHDKVKSKAPAGELALPSGPAGRRRMLRWLLSALGLGAVLIVIYFAGFAVFATHVAGLKTPFDPQQADAIIVLTGGQARLKAAVDLLGEKKGKRLLISGVHPQTGKSALLRATGADAGLFECCVDIDHAALDTIGNAVEGARWIAKWRYGKVIIVTNNYHLPRSLLEMQAHTDGVEFIAYPVVDTDLTQGGWLVRPAALRVFFTEYGKYVMALIRRASW